MMRKMTLVKTIKWVVLTIVIIVGICAAGFGMFLLVNTVMEWKPAQTENALLAGEDQKGYKNKVPTGKNLTLLSYNIGYGALGEDSDYFLDGGKDVLGQSKEVVEKNLEGIVQEVKEVNPDFLCIQEVDRNSKRSFFIDQREFLDEKLGGDSAFAYNFKSRYIPYPFPQMTGRAEAGLYTQSDYNLQESTRESLPVPFKWPVRMFNLKRCLLVSRIPVKDSHKELVIVNLHLEAYDDGKGKVEQTKALMDFIGKEADKGNYVIACGDFNQAMYIDDGLYKLPKKEGLWKPAKLDLGEAGKNWQLLYDKSTPSCRLDNQPYTIQDENTYYFLIDGVIVSPNIKVESIKNLDKKFKYSDHNPVELKFQLLD